MTTKLPMDPFAPATAKRRGGRKIAVPEWTDAEADHAAEHLIANDPSPFLTDTMTHLWDYLALTEERLYWLMAAPRGQWGSSYPTFFQRLTRLAQSGIIAIAPSVVSKELQDSGYAALRPKNPRYARIVTLGKIGRVVAHRLWGGPSFVPEGNETHSAHHALAAEAQFRISEAAREFRQKDYRPEGPRKCVVMDPEKKYAALSPDGMLRERRPTGSDKTPVVWVVEYHNEERTGRAKEKIEAYLRLMGKPDLWQSAWGLEQFPKVLVVYRHDEVARDWARHVKALAGPRRDVFKMLSLKEVMAGGEEPLRLKGVA